MILTVHVVVVVISVGAADMLMAAGKKGGKKAAPKPAASAKPVRDSGLLGIIQELFIEASEPARQRMGSSCEAHRPGSRARSARKAAKQCSPLHSA